MDKDIVNTPQEEESLGLEMEGEPESAIGKAISSIEHQAFEQVMERSEEDTVYMGTASLADIATGNISKPTLEDVEKAEAEQAEAENAQIEPENAQKSEEELADQAIKKLDGELNGYKGKGDGQMVKLLVEYLRKRTAEDPSMAADILQEHKTLSGCVNYVYAQARKQATGNCAVVRDDVVFEWGEDYYRKDDKAEAEKAKKERKEEQKKEKAREAKGEKSHKELKRKIEKAKAKTEVKASGKVVAPSDTPQKKEKRQKKDPGTMDGQMDLFSMMGL